MLTLRQRTESALLRGLLLLFGGLPRGAARAMGATAGAIARVCFPRLRNTGLSNLELAYPSSTRAWREETLSRTFRNLGWQIAEFAQMRRYTRENVAGIARMEGFEYFASAETRGQGVLILTGHIGAWELSSFYFSLLGHPMGMVIRRLDNPAVDKRVNSIRCLHGNRVLHKDDSARPLLQAMHANGTVGILMDTNMTPPQGVFAPFFGIAACTASGLARVALKTGAAVVPGFMVWSEAERKYVLHFLPELPTVRTGDTEADVLENTATYNAALEGIVRQYPDQWLWLHRRWKTRPPGEPSLYS